MSTPCSWLVDPSAFAQQAQQPVESANWLLAAAYARAQALIDLIDLLDA